jgi:hypothetical protein
VAASSAHLVGMTKGKARSEHEPKQERRLASVSRTVLMPDDPGGLDARLLRSRANDPGETDAELAKSGTVSKTRNSIAVNARVADQVDSGDEYFPDEYFPERLATSRDKYNPYAARQLREECKAAGFSDAETACITNYVDDSTDYVQIWLRDNDYPLIIRQTTPLDVKLHLLRAHIYAPRVATPVGESIALGYTRGGREDRQTAAEIPPGIMPDAAHDLNALAADLDLPFEVARKALQQAKAELTTRETTSRSATAEPRPKAAATETTNRKRGPRVKPNPALPAKAPEIYHRRKPREELGGRKEKLTPFLRRVYGPLLEIMTHADLMRLDPTAGKAIYNTKDGKNLPPGLLPREFELNTPKRIEAANKRLSKVRVGGVPIQNQNF